VRPQLAKFPLQVLYITLNPARLAARVSRHHQRIQYVSATQVERWIIDGKLSLWCPLPNPFLFFLPGGRSLGLLWVGWCTHVSFKHSQRICRSRSRRQYHFLDHTLPCTCLFAPTDPLGSLLLVPRNSRYPPTASLSLQLPHLGTSPYYSTHYSSMDSRAVPVRLGLRQLWLLGGAKPSTMAWPGLGPGLISFRYR